MQRPGRDGQGRLSERQRRINTDLVRAARANARKRRRWSRPDTSRPDTSDGGTAGFRPIVEPPTRCTCSGRKDTQRDALRAPLRKKRRAASTFERARRGAAGAATGDDAGCSESSCTTASTLRQTTHDDRDGPTRPPRTDTRRRRPPRNKGAEPTNEEERSLRREREREGGEGDPGTRGSSATCRSTPEGRCRAMRRIRVSLHVLRRMKPNEGGERRSARTRTLERSRCDPVC